MTLLISYLVIGAILCWFELDWLSVILVSVLFLLLYVAIWLVMFLRWKHQMLELNLLTKEYQNSVEDGPSGERLISYIRSGRKTSKQ